jgi:hypothetical protein
MMRKTDLDVIKDAFQFLIDQYGFSIVGEKYYSESFGNIVLELRSKKMEIRIVLDRSILNVEFRPRKRLLKSEWFGFQSLYRFLVPGDDEQVTDTIRHIYEHGDDTTTQASRAARIVHSYLIPVVTGEFSQWKELDKQLAEKARKDYERITGKRYRF